VNKTLQGTIHCGLIDSRQPGSDLLVNLKGSQVGMFFGKGCKDDLVNG
jgi:hypothetical protein